MLSKKVHSIQVIQVSGTKSASFKTKGGLGATPSRIPPAGLPVPPRLERTPQPASDPKGDSECRVSERPVQPAR
jgi:hypothetical protein